jgi:hypothetical protein
MRSRSLPSRPRDRNRRDARKAVLGTRDSCERLNAKLDRRAAVRKQQAATSRAAAVGRAEERLALAEAIDAEQEHLQDENLASLRQASLVVAKRNVDLARAVPFLR